MKYRRLLISVAIAVILMTGLLPLSGVASATPGENQNGILVEEWRYDFYPEAFRFAGSSSAIADLGVNNEGTEPDGDLEIVTGSDEFGGAGGTQGVWRTFDSKGNLEWSLPTQTDEARSSPAIADITGDGDLEIAGGTTSGWYVQVFDNTGDFVWTFPKLTEDPYPPANSGPFMWPSSPALADVNGDGDLEVIIANRYYSSVWCFDGDPSDGANEGATIDSNDYSWEVAYGPLGEEGKDWDVLWIYDIGMGDVWSSPAVGDVDNDDELEVVIGSEFGYLYVLSAEDGELEHAFPQVWGIDASPAIADIDSDSLLEIVVGSRIDYNVYCLQWDGSEGTVQWSYYTAASVYSSAAIGDVDMDGYPEIVVGSWDGYVYCLTASGDFEWRLDIGGRVHSSPALALRTSTSFGIYVGSEDGYLYLIDGSGSLIDRFQTYGGIGTSPSVADVDGDEMLEVFFYDCGEGSIYDGHTYWALQDQGSECAAYSIEWGMFRHDICHTGTYPNFGGPIASNVVASPNPAPVNGSVKVTADIDDTTTGGSNIGSAEYSLDGVNWYLMSASDGAFDEASEGVTAPPFNAPGVPGIYDLCVRGTDAAGNVGEPVCIMLVVYDPAGGFVTGGGWIDSPKGAYRADANLVGKANFGFVSKYQKGAKVPTGNTEFQFKVADLNFHSSNYDWLVVNQAGTNAQFKGTGTINGSGVYKFMLWAGDGAPDTFQIKIWTEENGGETVIYDNGFNQAIAGGSIVIHKK